MSRQEIALAEQDNRQLAEQHIYRPPNMLDPARFDHLMKWTELLMWSGSLPESLTKTGPYNNKRDLPEEVIRANVFMVVEQAERWNISPSALLGCAAIVHGKLGFEGKVIASVLEAHLGVRLDYLYAGEGDEMTVVVSGRRLGDAEPKIVKGTVKSWKTSGNNSPWKPDSYEKMLAYRGAREWARIWAPAAIMGIVSDDEALEMENERRALAARDVSESGTGLVGRISAASRNVVEDVASELAYDPKTGEVKNKPKADAKAETKAKPKAEEKADDKKVEETREESSTTSTEKEVETKDKPESKMTADQMKEYGQALFRIKAGSENGKEKLVAMIQQYWVDNEAIKPLEGSDDMVAVREINRLHTQRVQGQLPEDECRSLLREITGP